MKWGESEDSPDFVVTAITVVISGGLCGVKHCGI